MILYKLDVFDELKSYGNIKNHRAANGHAVVFILTMLQLDYLFKSASFTLFGLLV